MFLKNSSLNKKTRSLPEPAEWITGSPESAALFEEILNSGLSLRIRATGKSMAPFLNGGEIVTINKGAGSSCHIGDLIFFKTRYGSLLLHRIIRKRYKDMVILQTKGDAVQGADEPVSEHNVLGKVCTIEKSLFGMGTKHIHMESRFWKTVNYLLAVISSLRSRIYFPIFR